MSIIQMTIGHSSAILEKGSRWIMWHLGKRAVYWVRQTGEGKREEKSVWFFEGEMLGFYGCNGCVEVAYDQPKSSVRWRYP